MHLPHFPLRRLLATILIALAAAPLAAQDFDRYFEDATLRLDYIFAGDARQQSIHLTQLLRQEQWAGRRTRLAESLLRGNGRITVRDHASGEVIYLWTFSTLFQEYLQYDEAKTLSRAFECSYNIPFPKAPVDVSIELMDVRGEVVCQMSHAIDPTNVLIRRVGQNGIPFRYMWQGRKDELDIRDCVDVAIVAEGYTEQEMDKFYADCQRATDALFEREPFSSMKERFNVVAVAAPSLQSGPSIPRKGIWHSTAVCSHFDTFYSDRYLTTSSMHRLYDLLSGVPFEHVIVLVNTDVYGGGGIYNQVTVATSDHPTFKQVLVHEFGHAYGGLADEYAYDDMDECWYPADVEPWEPNITTLKDFRQKWADMLPEGTPIPTPLDPDVPNIRRMDRNDPKALERLNRSTHVLGVFEGAGYQTKGCYRPVQECRMKVNEVLDFCPVCTRAIRRVTDFYTSK